VSAVDVPPTRDELEAAMASAPAFADGPPISTEPGTLNRYDVPKAVLAPDWLPPDTRWPELNELRETHVRLRESASAAARRASALERQFEEEDRLKDAALKAGFAAGAEPELPAITPDAERASLLKEARTVAKAATGASLDHIDKVLQVFGHRYAEFTGDLDAEEHGLSEQIREAEARVAELRSRQGTFERTRNWIDRIREVVEGGLPVSMWVMRWADVPVSAVFASAQARAAFTDAATKTAHGDGTRLEGVPNPARDRPGQPDTLLVPRGSAPPAPLPDDEQGEEVDLADLEHEDVVDWLMGAGMFDGEPKPTVSDVIEVVETDNPDLARRVLAADTEAYGGAPRKGVADALNKIIKGGSDV
jgi:hypothetical protein